MHAFAERGYRPRRWDTRAGTIGLNIPKLRKGSYFPTFLEPRRTAEKALMAVIQEAYIHGVSTRAVDDLVRAMRCPAGDCKAIAERGLTGTSKSQVSRLCEEIDERVQAFLNRPLEGSIRMNSVPRTGFPTVRETVGAVDGPSSGSTPPT